MQQVVLVTGSSSGFGLLTVLKLASQGYKVFAGFRSLEGKNADVAARLQKEDVETVAFDVTDQSSVDQAMQMLLKKTEGCLDIVINNAGRAALGLVEEFTPEQLQELFEINVFAVQRTMRATLPILRKRKSGLIINISSVAGRIPLPSLGVYSASKQALEALSDCYRYELLGSGVDIVIIEPGSYPTKIGESAIRPLDSNRLEQYGAGAEIPGKVMQAVVSASQSECPPDPSEVADAIAAVISGSPGNRPQRVTVGQSYGVDRMNNTILPFQRTFLESFGLYGNV